MTINIVIMVLASVVLAHPHTFITTRLGVEFEQENIKGVWINWEFDEMFSTTVLEDVDLNRNNKIDKNEVDLVYKDAFSNLENYGYFFYIRKGKNRTTAKKVEQFSAWNNNGKLIYKFFIPINNSDNELIFSIFDPTFFCAVTYYKNKPVYFINDKLLKASCKIIPNKKYPV